MPIDPRIYEKYAGRPMDPYADGKALARLSGEKSARELRGPTLIGIVIGCILIFVMTLGKWFRRAELAERQASEPALVNQEPQSRTPPTPGPQ